MDNFTFHIPTRIIFGQGKIKELITELPAKTHNILIVTDSGIFHKTDIINRVVSNLPNIEVSIYHEIEENPSLLSINKGSVFVKEKNVDLVIGVGGGSAMDAAKGIALMATNPGNIADYISGAELHTDPLPVVCIPTTSGTGSEVTPFAVFTDPENEVKLGYANEKLFPILSIIDPELCNSMPDKVIIDTGLDSLSHAVEAYLSTESFDLIDQIALHSIKLVINNLKNASNKNKQAMGNMAYSAMLSGITIAHASTILPHIMGYSLTVYHNVSHGRAGAILLPVFLDYLRNQSIVKEKIQELDKVFSSCGGLHQFMSDLRVSTRLSDYGVEESELNNYVQKTIVKSDVEITPAKITREVIYQLYLDSL